MTPQEWIKKKRALEDAGFKEEPNPAKFVRDYKSKPNKYETTTVSDHTNTPRFFW